MEPSAIWPSGAGVDDAGALTVHGRTAQALLGEFGSPLYVMDLDEVRTRARRFVAAAADGFPTSTTRVSFAAKAFLSREVARIALDAGMLIDTCTLGEMRIALSAGAPGRRLVLHGNNKSDEEIALAVRQGFARIVVDEPDEPARIAAIARRLGLRARVMLRVTSGIHAGGHDYISTAHEDQKFGVPLLPASVDAGVLTVLDDLSGVTPAGTNARVETVENPRGVPGDAGEPTGGREPATGSERRLRHDVRYPYDLSNLEVAESDRRLARAMEAVADGPALAVLKEIARHPDELELVGVHSHIGSQIHDAAAFIEAARRMMLLRRTFYATDAVMLPEVDLGGGYSVAYTDDEDAMDVQAELARLGADVRDVNEALGMPQPVISFEPGRWIVAPAGLTLYRVGVVKRVALSPGTTDGDGSPLAARTYVSVDGGMSDNIRPALYGADYTARLANRTGSSEVMRSRVVGMHCESGDIVVRDCLLPADLRRGDVLAVPVTGAYGRTMASNYNQAPIPAVVGVDSRDAHVMIRRQTIDDLLALDMG
ncbi:diaminopimelate decarboxylase [uncultured Bifidobacterium sp.]|uniref:diaminopimelate decarboxylase family protein n=1 Tax=uncultured Bifidobacterium sp. TaxID=165187 RepID=UPI0028DC910A|nr:diaminopimelate decarboxylase [uncultured Bifidobacterium sp.]